ncbi:hypothetical protein BB560_007191 [Smittium megazygosporum]|uniref:PUM-HD domain-containing protein n=1 Tax=Smittium megazygosporum TaxID=133381 RepID=A0A2T9XY45_9FUNG|nr:hypothetical protein BB560_007191 [Smittium megazygosporum]
MHASPQSMVSQQSPKRLVNSNIDPAQVNTSSTISSSPSNVSSTKAAPEKLPSLLPETAPFQQDPYSKHNRARSYGTSLLDILNDKVHSVNSQHSLVTRASTNFNSFPLASDFNSSKFNLHSQSKSVHTVIDPDSSNFSTPLDIDPLNSSIAHFSNESIFGFSNNIHPPPPGLQDPLSNNNSSEQPNLSLLNNNHNLSHNPSQNNHSTLLRGNLNNPLARIHSPSSSSLGFNRVKNPYLSNSISPDLQSENYWSAVATDNSELLNSNSSRLYQPSLSEEVPPVPQLPNLASLTISTSSSAEVSVGNPVSRGASVPENWVPNKQLDNPLLNYSFGSSVSKINNTTDLSFSQKFISPPLRASLEQRTHNRSRTLGNALESISTGLYPPSLLNNNDPNNAYPPVSSLRSSDLDPNSFLANYNDPLVSDSISFSQSRHFRQASLGILGLGRNMNVDKLNQSSSSSNLAAFKHLDNDPSLLSFGNFSNIGRSGTNSLIHGLRPSSHHHPSSLSTSGTLNPSSDLAPTRSLWVGSLDIGITPRDLIEYFGKFGRIESLRTLPDKECAFINFMRLEDAMRAHDDMQGSLIKNSIIRVGYGKGEGYAISDAQAMQPTRALWVGNISPSTTPASLRAFFEAFGVVESARILGQKSCGFVNFERLEDAVRAKQATNGRELDGVVVRIGYAKVPVRGTEGFTRPRNQVPVAPPLTASGRIAEANAIVGTSSSGLGSEDILEPGVPVMDENLVAFPYATSLPSLPTPSIQTGLGQSRLREIRKRLDAQCSQSEFDTLFKEVMPTIVDLCSDYVGNMLVQKLIDRGSLDQKLFIVKAVSPYIASIGIHKNGTWAIQKIIECANDRALQEIIVEATRPYIPQLLLDQLGNYVVQCCLNFPENRNQFVFDAIHARSWDIAQGRFGARAIRTCLDHNNTTRAQQKLVAVVLVLNAVALSTNANGNILITWLLDFSNFPGRFRVVAPQLAGHLRYLCTHKLGSATILKIIDQREEPDARDLILNTLFFNPEPQVLDDVLSDQVHGTNVVYKTLCSFNVDESEKVRIASRVKGVLLPLLQQGIQGYQKLNETVDNILLNNTTATPDSLDHELLPISELIQNFSSNASNPQSQNSQCPTQLDVSEFESSSTTLQSNSQFDTQNTSQSHSQTEFENNPALSVETP